MEPLKLFTKLQHNGAPLLCFLQVQDADSITLTLTDMCSMAWVAHTSPAQLQDYLQDQGAELSLQDLALALSIVFTPDALTLQPTGASHPQCLVAYYDRQHKTASAAPPPAGTPAARRVVQVQLPPEGKLECVTGSQLASCLQGLMLALLDSHLDLTQQLAAAGAEQQLLQAATATCLDAAGMFKDRLVELLEERHPGCTTQQAGGGSSAGGGLATPSKRSRLEASLLAPTQQPFGSMAASQGQQPSATSPGPLLGSQGTPGKAKGDGKQARMSLAEDRATKLLKDMPPDLSVLCDRDTLTRAAAMRQLRRGGGGGGSGKRAASGGLADAAASAAAAAAREEAATAAAAATQAADWDAIAPAADAGVDQGAAAEEEDEEDAADVTKLVAAVGQAARAPTRDKRAGPGLLSVLGGPHRGRRKRG